MDGHQPHPRRREFAARVPGSRAGGREVEHRPANSMWSRELAAGLAGWGLARWGRGGVGGGWRGGGGAGWGLEGWGLEGWGLEGRGGVGQVRLRVASQVAGISA